MSLITRCPACETLFKVVPDQLRISDGWVRCGQCEEVFDASRNLLSDAPPSTIIMDRLPGEETPPAVRADISEFLDSLDSPPQSDAPVMDAPESWYEPQQPTEELASTPQIMDEPSVSQDIEIVETMETTQQVVDVEGNESEPIEGPEQENHEDIDEEVDDEIDSSWGALPDSELPSPDDPDATNEKISALDLPRVPGELPLELELQEFKARRSAHAPLSGYVEQVHIPGNEESPVSVAHEESDSTSPPSDLSFMQGSLSYSAWHSPLVRVGLVVMALALLVCLVAQVTIRERDRIASTAPAALPWVTAVCGIANCRISPLRQIESIVIESSSFAKTKGEMYRFNFVVRNVAITALATPSVELSLTDLQNRPIVRRVFSPSELGAATGPLMPGAEWAGSLDMRVKPTSDTERISGYRVLAFYP